MKLREMNEAKSVYLLYLVAFRWVKVSLVFLLFLSFQHSSECTANTLVWDIWLHHFKQKEGVRERERHTHSGPLISLYDPPLCSSSIFPTQIVIPYLGEGREGKRDHVTAGFGVVTERNSPDFSLRHWLEWIERKQGGGGGGGMIKSVQFEGAQEGRMSI